MGQFEDIYKKDIYTSSGSVSLLNCWTANVDKHDTSSFYNWEQDNEPLYDLEERTQLNWEKLGFPTSSVPGLSLVVSADATATGCSKSVFLTLSSCLEALPKFVDFPVLIEVANFGGLGSMDLNNVKIGSGGSIEIINRNSYRGLSYTMSGNGAATPAFEEVGTDSAIHPYNQGRAYSGGKFDKYLLFSGVSAIDESYKESSSWALKQQMVGASALSISTPVLSATTDTRFAGNTNVFISGPGKNSGNWGLTVGVDGNGPRLTGGHEQVSCTPYEESNLSEVLLYDSSSYNSLLGSTSEIYKLSVDTLSTNSKVYGNYLDSITITNCEGPLYIRGFLVNGNRSVQNGIVVKNSNVVLEGCASVLNNGNGFLFDNSEVTLTRGVLAYRNYLQEGSARLDGGWTNLSLEDSKFKDDTAGIKAFNSHITLSSTSAFEFSIRDSASGIYPVNDMNQCARNTNGISLINSVFDGGLEQTTNMAVCGTPNNLYTKTYMIVDHNTHNGLVSKGSTIDIKGRFSSFNNLRGMDISDTNATLDEFGFQANHRQGIRSNNSNITYNSSFQNVESASKNYTSQWSFSGNGQHLELNDSSFLPSYGDSMDSNFGLMTFYNPHGIDNKITDNYYNITPSIKLTNGSKAEFMHPLLRRHNEYALDYRPAYGSLVSVDGGSEAVFRGSKNYATKLIGPHSYEKQRFTAGVYADNGSKVEFTGPTVIAQFGVDVLADNNSTMSFNPPRDPQKGGCDASAFNLADGANHTMVELHSTRACLVADNGSVINMEHLGDFQRQWNRGSNGLVAVASTDFSLSTAIASQGIPYFNINTYVSAGSMQFYPNPNDDGDYIGGSPAGIEEVGSNIGPVSAGGVVGFGADHAFEGKAVAGLGSEVYYKYLDSTKELWDADSHEANGLPTITGGGMCVRALHGSEVNVNNVHFPAGWANASSVYYDSSSANLCDRLFIWNIADSSKLFASYISVSGCYPSDIGYFGPSSVWANPDSSVAYAAPSATPDTSSLSVLDYFGTGPTGLILPTPSGGALLNAFGPGTSQNQGPFRLFLSPDPVVNHMSNLAGDQFGLPNQLFSQGYHYSGNLYVSGAVSALHGDVVKWNMPMSDVYRHNLAQLGQLATGSNAGLGTSGFYYASEMLGEANPTIYLEESAANTFANAKHLSVGKSGLAKKVHIYQPYTTQEGDSAKNANKQYGRGYRSSSQFDLGKGN
tara:strand:- start:5622 stop:9242 length:3621 start_codon:yes stop_codon:yes gene_type:complete